MLEGGGLGCKTTQGWGGERRVFVEILLWWLHARLPEFIWKMMEVPFRMSKRMLLPQ